jgi:putative YjhG/YagF family dehydratase
MTLPIDSIFSSAQPLQTSRLLGEAPEGRMPLDADTLRSAPSGDLFGMTQSVAMGWNPEEINRDHFVIVSTHGGLRAPDGTPVALGYHTGHWEVHLQVERAAQTFREFDTIPFAVHCSDPCDGRTQGTTGMFDSLPYRNDAAVTLRRLIRSLPTRCGVMGIGTCDKGLPAVLMALAGMHDLPGIVVPGGVTLPTPGAEDAGTVQTIGVRFAHDLISLDYAAEMACRACGSSGGGCQFLGTAATTQVVAEALGLALPHSALAPSGEPVWYDIARRSALALMRLHQLGITLQDILTREAFENAMLVHAAVGGSTNLLLHVPAIAHAAGLPQPTVEDWMRANRSIIRLVDALPNGPRYHPTVQVYFAGGVPEVLLHLRDAGLLHLDAMTVTGLTLGENLAWWEDSEARTAAKQRLTSETGVQPEHVIMSPEQARQAGLTSTFVFPTGNLAPEGSVIKATAIDPTLIDAQNRYAIRARARVFTSEQSAIQAVKGQTEHPVSPGDVIVLIGSGPMGTGMEETYQITAALKHLPWGKHIPIVTDGRFSGVSTGACIGHVGPEALVGGPLGKVRDGDVIEIVIDRDTLAGEINLVGTGEQALDRAAAAHVLAERPVHPDLAPHPDLPLDTQLWALLQQASGGTWAGCVYDLERIRALL